MSIGFLHILHARTYKLQEKLWKIFLMIAWRNQDTREHGFIYRQLHSFLELFLRMQQHHQHTRLGRLVHL